MMDFDDQTVRSDRDRGARQRHDFVALAGAVAGIDDDGQMAETLHRGNRCSRSRVLRVWSAKVRTPRSHRITL